jgi:hypothetical protein
VDLNETPAPAEPDSDEAIRDQLREALEERNRLWAELQRRRVVEEDLAYWRARAEDIERSRWWRAGAPLRLAKRILADPPGTLEQLAFGLRERRRDR